MTSQNKKIKRIIRLGWLVNVVRYLTCATFVFSGFVKALDPKGMGYKLDAYAESFHLNQWLQGDVTLVWAVVMASVEFLLGIYLLFGIRRKFTTTILFFIMLLFTPFTLYLAFTNPVHDCGCFGDAILLTNWQTFFKNVVLLLFTFLMFRYKKLIFTLVPVSVHWAYSLYSMIYIVALCLFTIHYLPLVDMRPYKVGVNIAKAMEIPKGAKEPVYDMTFLMEKNGERREFDLANYPDSTWTYVSMKKKLVEPGYTPSITDFSITSESGDDLTQQVLSDTTTTFVLVSPHLEDADPDITDELNTIHDYCMDKGMNMLALTASGNEAIARWRYTTGAVYPIYFTDEITLKTMVRSNPGLMLLKQGSILNKWSCNNFPQLYAADPTSDSQLHHVYVEKASAKLLLKIVFTYVIPLLFITLALNLGVAWKRSRRIKRYTTK